MNKYILLSFSLYFSCNAMEENWHDQEPISDKQFEKITKNFAKEVLELKKEEDQLKQQENKWQHYDTHSKPQYEASLQNLKNFDLSKYKTILELGCNTGNVSAILAQQYPKINFIGIDPEEAAIKLGKEKHGQQENLQLMLGDAQKYKLDSPANFIFCYHVLHWIKREDQPAVFKNIASHLTQDGTVNITCSAKQPMTPMQKAVIRTVFTWKWCSYIPRSIISILTKGENKLTLLTQEELKQYAVDAGLHVHTCEAYNKCFYFDSKEEFGEWFLPILRQHIQMEEPKLKDFIKDVVERYCTDYGMLKNGKIGYPLKELHLIALKR